MSRKPRHRHIQRGLMITTAALTVILVMAASGPSDDAATNHFGVGPNVGVADRLRAPIDLYWDHPTRRLHARSLVLTEVGDPVDVRIRRAPGVYPDGPLDRISAPGEISGGIHWDTLTTEGWRQVAGIEGMPKDHPAPSPTAGNHPGWLTFYTYAEHHDDRVRRAIIDDTGAMSLGGGGFGGEGLPTPTHGFHLFGGGLRIQAVTVPQAPRLSVSGGAGSRRYVYQLVACDSKDHETPPGPPAEILGPDRLDAEHSIRLEWDRCPGAETYRIIRDGRRLDLEFRGEGTVKSFEDRGLPAVSHEPADCNRTADTQIDGSLAVGQAFSTPGVCSPEPLAADAHDYSPLGLDGCTTLALRAAKRIRITGLKAPPTPGRWLLIVNSGEATVTLANEAEASSAANRFRTGTPRDFALGPDQTTMLAYTLDRWRFIVGPHPNEISASGN